MKKLILFLIAASLQAATFYVANPGNNANAGTSVGAPWADLQYAVNHAACGDIINIVANGAYVPGDANLPYMAGCSLVTTIQSSALAQFWPPGYRTNPTNDAAIYGKLQFTTGIIAQPEAHGSNYANSGNYGACDISSVSGVTITLGYCGSGMPNLANGSQIEFEIDNAAFLAVTSVPSPLTFMQHYFVVNCGAGCGTTGSTLQVAATSGGSAISLTCIAPACVPGGIHVTEPLQFTSGSSTITSPDAFGFGTPAIANNTPVTLNVAGLQSIGTLPTPFTADTIYYIVNLSGRTFGLSSSLGGAAITATSVGLGPIDLANTNVPSRWAFRGLEFYSATNPAALLTLGSGDETSALGMVRNIEVDRNYFHGDVSACPSSGPKRGISESGIGMYIHDNYFTSFCTGEGQAIVAYGSPGPTEIVNNFLEAAAENTMSGGKGNSSGTTNSKRTFRGNYYYKPPAWKQTTNTGAPSVGVDKCLYDATDPLNVGGEWYRDTNTSQNYRCAPNGTWAATGLSLPAAFTIKNMAEFKNGSYHTYIGNVFNYSWVAGQSGQAMAFHQGEDSGPGRGNDHITAMHNKIQNVNEAITQQSHCNLATIYCAVLPSNHVVVNNLAVLNGLACGVTFATGGNTCGYPMHFSNMNGYPSVGDFFNHNTAVAPDGASVFYPPPGYNAKTFFASTDDDSKPCLTLPWGLIYDYNRKNSIEIFDFQGDCYNGGQMIAGFFTNSNFHHLALQGSNNAISYANPGVSNTFPPLQFARTTNLAGVGYVNAPAGDYHLAPTSLFSAANGSATVLSDDLTDLGADIDLINMATSGAAAGTPASDVQAGLSILAGSTKAVFRYTAPNAGVCTATLYFSLVRIPMNVAPSLGTSFPDSAVGSIYDPSRRELLITGLTANSSYWYKLVCPSANVTMVGSFATRATGAAVNWPVGTPGGGTVTYSVNADMSGSSTTGSGTSQLIPVPSNVPIYWKQTTDTSPPSILLAP